MDKTRKLLPLLLASIFVILFPIASNPVYANPLSITSSLGPDTTVNNSTLPIFPTYPIPALNSQIQFTPGTNFSEAKLENNTWFFEGLTGSGKAGSPLRGNLHVSANNCSMLISYLQSWSQPETHSSAVQMQWIHYSVVGAGTQTISTADLFPDSTQWTDWTIAINGVKSHQVYGWNYSDSKNLTVITPAPESHVEITVYHEPVDSSLAPLPEPSPALHSLNPSNIFSIPANNGSIKFAVDGSYDQANLDVSWSFVNLTLASYSINAGHFAPNVTGRNVLPYILQRGYPADLGVEVKNSDITIAYLAPLTFQSQPELNYTLRGTGNQTFTFPFNISDFNWTVYIDGTQRRLGEGWVLAGDHQIEVASATSYVSIQGELLPRDFTPRAYDLTGVAILLTTLAIACLTVAAILVWKRRRS